MKTKPKKNIPGGCISLAVTLLYALCVRTVFSACPPKADGSFMMCHGAGELLKGITLVMAGLALAAVLAPGKRSRRAAELLLVAAAAVSAAVPGHICPLCMMPEMHCRMLMQPGALLFAFLTVLSAGIELLRTRGSGQKRGTGAEAGAETGAAAGTETGAET